MGGGVHTGGQRKGKAYRRRVGRGVKGIRILILILILILIRIRMTYPAYAGSDRSGRIRPSELIPNPNPLP